MSRVYFLFVISPLFVEVILLPLALASWSELVFNIRQMPTEKTKIIPKPKEGTRTVLVAKGSPIIEGEGEGKGDMTYLCGNCDTLLLENAFFTNVRNVVFQCPRCGLFSELTSDYH